MTNTDTLTSGLVPERYFFITSFIKSVSTKGYITHTRNEPCLWVKPSVFPACPETYWLTGAGEIHLSIEKCSRMTRHFVNAQ